MEGEACFTIFGFWVFGSMRCTMNKMRLATSTTNRCFGGGLSLFVFVPPVRITHELETTFLGVFCSSTVAAPKKCQVTKKEKNMGEETAVSLHGMWASPYTRWIKIALKIKGINYEYVEEKMKKKSQILLRYNPIYKKVPLLIHDNNPIVESLVILQYIDDTWKVSPLLFPLDPYTRYIVRFWADFIINQLYMSLRKVITSEEMNIEEVKMKLKILEASMNTIFPYDPPSSCEEMRMLDILMCTLPTIIKGTEEAFGIKLMDEKEYPLIFSRMSSLSDLNVVKETAPSHEKMIKFYRNYRHFYTSK